MIWSSKIKAYVLKLFGADIGPNVTIKPHVRVKYPWNLTIGPDSWIGEGVWIDNLANVDIGHDVCVSQEAYLCTGNHDWSDERFALIVKPITLAEGAWVGARCTIGPGVVIARCGVACAGSSVYGDIPEYEVHGGNPAAFKTFRRIRSSEESVLAAGVSPEWTRTKDSEPWPEP